MEQREWPTQDPLRDGQFKGRGRGTLFFLKEQLVMFVVVMSAAKLTLAPVKIMCVGSKSMIYSAAVTATMYGRSI